MLGQIAALLDKHTEIGRRHRLCEMLEELRVSIMNELDYEREAHNLINDGREPGGVRPHRRSAARRATTPRGACSRWNTCADVRSRSLSPWRASRWTAWRCADQLFKAYLKQVLVDGLFHADPHPGNVFVTDDERIALLDLGMVGHTTPRCRTTCSRSCIAVSEGKGEEAAES